MIVINQLIPGSFMVQTDRGAETMNQDGMLRVLQDELHIEIGFMDEDMEKELVDLRDFRDCIMDGFKSIIKDMVYDAIKEAKEKL